MTTLITNDNDKANENIQEGSMTAKNNIEKDNVKKSAKPRARKGKLNGQEINIKERW